MFNEALGGGLIAAPATCAQCRTRCNFKECYRVFSLDRQVFTGIMMLLWGSEPQS